GSRMWWPPTNGGYMRIPVILTALLLLLSPSPANAQDNALESFLSLPKDQVETITLRLEYLGSSDDLLPGMLIAVDGHSVNWDALRSASATKSKGPGDEIRQPQAKPTFTITVQDMQLFLRSIAPLANKAQEKTGEP